DALVLESQMSGGAWQPETGATASTSQFAEPVPQVLGAVQISPAVIEGGDRYGRLVGVLFSKQMSQTSAQTASKYTIGNGHVGDQGGAPFGARIKVTSAALNLNGRLAIVALDAPVGPDIYREIAVGNVADQRGSGLTAPARKVTMTVSPEGIPPGGY